MLNETTENEIARLSREYGIESELLSRFAIFVLKNQNVKSRSSKTLKELRDSVLKYFNVEDVKALRSLTKFQEEIQELKNLNFQRKESWERIYQKIIPPKPDPLNFTQLKEAVFSYFHVKDVKSLRQSSDFKLAVEDHKKIKLKKRESWENIYRQFIGILPNELNETGEDCINGINIFKYFRPWQVFGLDAKKANEDDIKNAYRELSKKYHPDNSETGNPRIFNQIHIMYKSILPKTFNS